MSISYPLSCHPDEGGISVFYIQEIFQRFRSLLRRDDKEVDDE